MMEKLGQWVIRHPDVLVLATGILMVQAVMNFGKAVEIRARIRSDLAQAASEALGG